MQKDKSSRDDAIAIIGMACIFPQAPDLATFWRNILAKVDAVGEPMPAWDADRYRKAGRLITSRGGYLRDLFRFDPHEFGVMPNSINGGEPDQFLALRVARDALLDAGYPGDGYDHRDTGIVLGHSTSLHRGQGTVIQLHTVLDQTMDILGVVCPTLDAGRLSEVRQLLEKSLPPYNSDAAPGLVPNVMTGRIANRLNLRGPNYLVDAACSSSLIAVNAAIDELRNGRSRMMLAGGVNASLPADVAVIFTQLGALSDSGKVRPFEAGSDGTLLGEGLGVVVLKRVEHAIEDGDRIYAVIRGIGQSSDGKGQGLLAPSVEGEALAIGRAYAASGIDPATISLVEAHGTGIRLGDKTEIAALKKVFGTRRGEYGDVAIGSVKSMICHCLPAAGIAGMIKTALALHHKILPPTLCGTVNPELGLDDTPFYINSDMRPWIAPVDVPRRAGVDSFGFGGINTHAILEEAPGQALKPQKLTAWAAELCVFAADSAGSLLEKLGAFREIAGKNGDRPLVDLAATLAAQVGQGDHRMAIIAENTGDLSKKIAQAIKRLTDSRDERWVTHNGIAYCARPLDGGLAFLFPGEGSQYQGMFADLAMCFDEVRICFDFWRSLYRDPLEIPHTDHVFPQTQGLSGQRRAEIGKRLHDMDVGSEAVIIGGQAMFALLKSLGVHADAMVGHSSGEMSALIASGSFASGEPRRQAETSRELGGLFKQMLHDGEIPTGVLLAVGALPQETVEKHIARFGGGVLVAMDNCPNQVVLFGDQASIGELQDALESEGAVCQVLPFDRAYHTPLFSGASAALLGAYGSMGMKATQIPLYSCASADLFPRQDRAFQELAAAQWSAKVRFRETVIKMHRDGIRYFVEVGPYGSLSAFVNDTLAGQEYVSVATNLFRRNDMEQLLSALGQLFVNRKFSCVDGLFGSRKVQLLDQAGSSHPGSAGMLLDNSMPMLRLSEADRSALGKLVAPAVSAMPESSAGPENGAGAMADYFAVMQSFLEQQQRLVESVAGNPDDWQHEHDALPAYAPFLDSIRERDPQHLVAECRLSVHEDNFLRDHVLSGPVSADPGLLGLSCVPLAASLEMMAEACAVLAGTAALSVIEDVRAFGWMALDDGELTVEIRAELADPEKNIYRAEVTSAGAVMVSADFLFAPEWRLEGLPELAEKREYASDSLDMYATGMFHGPIFQSVRCVDGWSDEGVDAQLSGVGLSDFFVTGATPQMVLNPVLLDAFGQLAAYWIDLQVGKYFGCFPSTIGRIELYGASPQDTAGLIARVRQQPLDPANTNMGARTWNCECMDGQGRVLVRTTNLINIFFPVPQDYFETRRDPLSGFMGNTREIAGKHGVTLWQLEQLPEVFCTQSGGIFLRTLAHAILGEVERDEWRRLPADPGRRREWLFGRACIKEAVRRWIRQETGSTLYPSDIIVAHDEHGAPHVSGWWNGSLAEAPQVSLGQDGRMALAAVAAHRHGVGAAILRAGKFQQPGLVQAACSASEQLLLQGPDNDAVLERQMRFWCAKEAAAKYFRTGSPVNHALFEVSVAGGDWESVRVTYAGKTVEVALAGEDEAIVALAS